MCFCPQEKNCWPAHSLLHCPCWHITLLIGSLLLTTVNWLNGKTCSSWLLGHNFTTSQHHANIPSTFKMIQQTCYETVNYLHIQQLTGNFNFESCFWPSAECKSNVYSLFLVFISSREKYQALWLLNAPLCSPAGH